MTVSTLDLADLTDTTDAVSESGAPGWRKSTACATNACVEVAEHPGRILVRDAARAVVAFDTDAWRQFITGIPTH